MAGQKDPRRQLIGALSKAKGERFENDLTAAFDYYRASGFASIEKTPEPMKPTKNLGNGKFIAFFTKKAQCDYSGTIKGGRRVIFEAKFTSADRMEQNRVSEEQTSYMKEHSALGARCFVLIGFGTGNAYRIPWEVWANMKEIFGHKYVTEQEIQKFKCERAWNGVLTIL